MRGMPERMVSRFDRAERVQALRERHVFNQRGQHRWVYVVLRGDELGFDAPGVLCSDDAAVSSADDRSWVDFRRDARGDAVRTVPGGNVRQHESVPAVRGGVLERCAGAVVHCVPNRDIFRLHGRGGGEIMRAVRRGRVQRRRGIDVVLSSMPTDESRVRGDIKET